MSLSVSEELAVCKGDLSRANLLADLRKEELDRQKADNLEFSRQLEELDRKLRAALELNHAGHGHDAEKDEQIELMQRELRQSHRECERMTQAKEDLLQELNKLRDGYGVLMEEKGQLENKLQQSESTLSEVGTLQNGNAQELMDLRRKLGEERERARSMENDHRQLNQQLEERARSVENENRQLTQQLESLASQADRIDSMASTELSLKRDNIRLVERENVLKTENSRLQEMSQKLLSRVQEMESTLQQVRNENSQLVDSLKQQEIILSLKKKEIRDLEQERSKIQGQLQELQAKVLALDRAAGENVRELQKDVIRLPRNEEAPLTRRTIGSLPPAEFSPCPELAPSPTLAAATPAASPPVQWRVSAAPPDRASSPPSALSAAQAPPLRADLPASASPPAPSAPAVDAGLLSHAQGSRSPRVLAPAGSAPFPPKNTLAGHPSMVIAGEETALKGRGEGAGRGGATLLPQKLSIEDVRLDKVGLKQPSLKRLVGLHDGDDGFGRMHSRQLLQQDGARSAAPAPPLRAGPPEDGAVQPREQKEAAAGNGGAPAPAEAAGRTPERLLKKLSIEKIKFHDVGLKQPSFKRLIGLSGDGDGFGRPHPAQALLGGDLSAEEDDDEEEEASGDESEGEAGRGEAAVSESLLSPRASFTHFQGLALKDLPLDGGIAAAGEQKVPGSPGERSGGVPTPAYAASSHDRFGRVASAGTIISPRGVEKEAGRDGADLVSPRPPPAPGDYQAFPIQAEGTQTVLVSPSKLSSFDTPRGLQTSRTAYADIPASGSGATVGQWLNAEAHFPNNGRPGVHGAAPHRGII